MTNRFKPVAPLDDRVGRRFSRANVLLPISAARLKDPLLSEQFIRLHEHKRYDDWFWLGEQIGKWLDASAYSRAHRRRSDVCWLGWTRSLRVLPSARRDDGYLGITSRFHRNAGCAGWNCMRCTMCCMAC